MILTDVNVLIYARREEMPDHARYRTWLKFVIDGETSFAVSELVLSGFVRVSTNPKVYKAPTRLEDALAFAERMRSAGAAHVVEPGPRHWSIFTALCRTARATGNLVPDAYFAALAIEHDLEWITTDRDYALFPGLRHRHPFT